MKLFLIAGQFHNVFCNSVEGQVSVVNQDQVYLNTAVAYLDKAKVEFDGILILDEGLNESGYQAKSSLMDLISYIQKNVRPKVPILLLTKDFTLFNIFNSVHFNNNLKIFLFDYVRMPLFTYGFVIDELKVLCKKVKNSKKDAIESEPPKRRFQFFERFSQKAHIKQEEIKATDELTKKFGSISKSISRVIVITGHRGFGLTSTAVNTAYAAHKRGLSSIIVDMDLDYRSTNMYFGSFNEYARRDEEINASLIRCLARPQDYSTVAFNVKDNLWLTTLSYSFNDRRLIEQFYTCSKFISMISVLRQKFNAVIIDMPMDLLKFFADSLIHVDVFGLCIPNNLNAVLNTLRNVNISVNEENIPYLNAKSKIIVTKYNNRARVQGDLFTPDRVCELMASDLSDVFKMELRLGGFVPYSFDFDSQIESDIPIANSNVEFEKAYANIFLRLMEGAN